jgi:hypothetical protein
MDKFTRKELIELILYKFNNTDKKEIIKKIKEKKKEVEKDIKNKIEKNIQPYLDDIYEEDLDDLDDFRLNFGLDSIQSKKRTQPPKINVEEIEKDFLKEYDDMINQLENNDSLEWFDIGGSKKKKNKKNKRGGSLPVKTIYKSIKNGYSYPKIEDLDDGFVFSKNGSDKEIQLYVNEKEKRIIINFIGTYTLFDWSNNYSYVLGKYKETKRFKRARDAFIKITDDYPNYKVILVGHSQSAVITNILNQEFPNRIYEVINLNGANLGETERDNEYNIRSKMDLVSLLHKPTKRDIIIDNKTNNILTEHKPNVLERLEQNRKIGR